MFDGLQQINWSQYDTSDGAGRDAVEWLTGLQSSEAKTRKLCRTNLSNLVNHQGHIAPIAYDVVPFLLELIAEPATEGVEALLVLVGDISVGGNHANFIKRPFESHTAVAWRIDDQRSLAEVRERVLLGFDSLLKRLSDGSGVVRGAAALALACLPERASESLPRLWQLLAKEKKAPTLGSYLLAIGTLSRATTVASETDAQRLQAFVDHKSDVVQTCALCALALAYPAQLPADGLEALLTTGQDLGATTRDLPWAGGTLGSVAHDAAVAACTAIGDTEALFRFGELYGASKIAFPLLETLFPHAQVRDEPLTLRDLNPVQVAGLSKFMELVKRQNVTIAREWLNRFGLPEPFSLSRMLGVTPRSPLEAEFNSVPVWLIAWRVAHGKAPMATWQVFVDTLDADQGIALGDEISVHRYGLGFPWGVSISDVPHLEEQAGWAIVGALAKMAYARGSLEALVALVDESLKAGQLLWPPLFALIAERSPAALSPDWDNAICELIGQLRGDIPNLRTGLAQVPLARREGILVRAEYNPPMADEGPLGSGETTVVYRQGWTCVDLCLTAAVAEKVVSELLYWKTAHLITEDDDLIDGLSDTPMKRSLGRQMHDFAVSTLVKFKQAAVPALEAKLGAASPFQRMIFEDALKQIRNSLN